MRIAVLSDIHGNYLALQAVLKDAAAQMPDLTVNLGDNLSGPLQPGEVASLLRSLAYPAVQGNHDRQVVNASGRPLGASDDYAAREVSEDDKAWLASLPLTLTLEGALLCHGTPEYDDRFLLENIGDRGLLIPAEPAEVKERLGSSSHSLVLCGHSHLPRALRLSEELLIVNPGSVGLQAYVDDQPKRHRVQTGTPHARYAIVDRTRGVWTASFRRVVYDWDRAAILSKRRGRHDWAEALSTGALKKSW